MLKVHYRVALHAHRDLGGLGALRMLTAPLHDVQHLHLHIGQRQFRRCP